MSDTTELQRLLTQLEAAPEEERLRSRAARALERADRGAEAHALLTDRLINLTAHDQSSLPCLCKRCLDPPRLRAELEGRPFSREHAVAKGRVLFFWVLETIPRSPAMFRAVEARMKTRLEANTSRRTQR